jgi:hypothetical protein
VERWRCRGGLLIAGLACEAVYLIAVLRLPWWRYCGWLRSWSQLLGNGPWAFAACLAAVLLLMIAYLWGWRLVARRSPGPGCPSDLRRFIWAGAILFALTLFWLLPITSDLFTYLSQAYVVTDLGLSPFEITPLDAGVKAGLEPLLLAYPSLYADRPCVYGPAWTLISAAGTLGPYDLAGGLAYLKGLVVAAFLGCAWLVERILREIRPEAAVEGLYLLAWNPLVLLMAVGDGHNDVAMVVLVLLAFWLLLRDRPVGAFAVLALSAWIKYVSAVFFPFFVIYVLKTRARISSAGSRGTGKDAAGAWPAIVGGILAAAGVCALVLIPFWSPQLLPGIVERLLHPVNWQAGTTHLATRALSVGLALFAVATLFVTWRLVREPVSFQRLANTGFLVVLLAFILGAARSQPWHLIWPAALAGLSDRKWAWPLIAGLSATMLAAQVWVEWGTPGW